MTRKFELTIGADPEFFVCKILEGGTIDDPMVACGKFGGGKGAPILLGDQGGFLEDGVTIEFNLVPAKSLREMQGKVFALVSEFEKQKQVKVAYHSSCSFKADELKKHPEAMAIGCAPDRYAYGLRSAPSVAQFKNRRFAGGHIHIGLDPWPEGLEKVNVVRYFDVMSLVPFMGVFHDQYRYSHYGYPGLYRETSYGVEWRSPDNYWCNPRMWDKKGGDNQRYLKAFMDRFDQSCDSMMRVLNKDGDGVRLNETIESFMRVHNIADLISTQTLRKKCNFSSQLRNAYGTLSAHVNMLIDTNKGSKKIKKQMLDLFLDETLDTGTDAP